MCLDCGRKPMQARGERGNSARKGPGSNPEPSFSRATVLSTAPPCCSIRGYFNINSKETDLFQLLFTISDFHWVEYALSLWLVAFHFNCLNLNQTLGIAFHKLLTRGQMDNWKTDAHWITGLCVSTSTGSRVYRHCTEFISTTCVPCVDLTFTSEPNGLLNCLSCTVCDPGQGLRVKAACTQTSDTVCEPQEGFYCTNDEKGSCTQAVEHTKCSPGQYIRQKGTASKDAECAGCKNGTYSDGSLEMCKQHTKCEDLGLIEIKPGTTTSDVKCGQKVQVALIVIIIVCIVVVLTLVGLYLRMKCKCNRNIVRNPETETDPDENETPVQTPTSETCFLPQSSSKMIKSTQPIWTI
ncbi:tumor necrosis factor receptor superfamily member 14-like isoform X2 [Neoarius graeffei]|uniref:tumor necrosis factor receptor superfamily member 14-like isoform X2 n=1 Tax=Neoarius graeffei TaxID=443677 RepID=UPI00298C3F19|nr:tumor necrosis factor receptor superfamily member 14-like isoform X2 [Neoarius graeffei]